MVVGGSNLSGTNNLWSSSSKFTIFCKPQDLIAMKGARVLAAAALAPAINAQAALYQQCELDIMAIQIAHHSHKRRWR